MCDNYELVCSELRTSVAVSAVVVDHALLAKWRIAETSVTFAFLQQFICRTNRKDSFNNCKTRLAVTFMHFWMVFSLSPDPLSYRLSSELQMCNV